MDGQVPALIFSQCLSALQLKEESPAPLTMAPPALLPVLLLSSFLFSPVPEEPSGFLHQAQLPWVICQGPLACFRFAQLLFCWTGC